MHIFGDKRIGTDDAVFADLGIIEHNRTDTNQAIITNGAAVKHRQMPNRHALANGDSNTFISVYHTVFLHITIFAQINRRVVRAYHRAKLYEREMMQRMEKQQALEDTKSDIGWGSQIRSYVLDDSRIKDLRTGVETSNTQAVLDGDLDKFIEASLKAGL